MATENEKPTLYLLSGDATFNLEEILNLFRKLTGREPTPAEIEETRAEMAKDIN